MHHSTQTEFSTPPQHTDRIQYTTTAHRQNSVHHSTQRECSAPQKIDRIQCTIAHRQNSVHHSIQTEFNAPQHTDRIQCTTAHRQNSVHHSTQTEFNAPQHTDRIQCTTAHRQISMHHSIQTEFNAPQLTDRIQYTTAAVSTDQPVMLDAGHGVQSPSVPGPCLLRLHLHLSMAKPGCQHAVCPVNKTGGCITNVNCESRCKYASTVHERGWVGLHVSTVWPRVRKCQQSSQV